MSKYVRTCEGIPALSNFADGEGTPIVIDLLTGTAYFVYKNVVTPLAGGSGGIPSGDIPPGSVVAFYNTDVPVGWTRVNVPTTRMIMLAQNGQPGGVTGGTDNPILNNKVPIHTHPLSGSTQTDGSHAHTFDFITWAPLGGGGSTSVYQRTTGNIQIGPGGIHSHSLSGGTADANAGFDADNWEPRYNTFVLASKD